MARIRFSKMHGAGNDFVVIDALEGDPVEDWAAFARFALDRHFGIGGDEMLILQPSKVADFFMGVRNVDGSAAENCGNGLRALTKYVHDRGYTRAERISFESLGGITRPRWLGDDRVEVEMQVPILEPEKVPTTIAGGPEPIVERAYDFDGERFRVTCVSMGNPHCVIFVDDPERTDVARLGPLIENHPVFPQRTNVEFVRVISRGELRQRTWERGTGETLACGSGACAVGVAAILAGRAESEHTIHLRGGDLQIRWAGPGKPVFKTGAAAWVFDGEVEYA